MQVRVLTRLSCKNVTAAAVASMQQSGAGKIEMVARIFAETGVKDLFKGIMHLVTKYQNKERIIRLRGDYIAVDPRSWASEYDISVNVGLGAGNRQEQMAMLGLIVQKQEQLLGAYGLGNPYVSPAQYRNTLGRMVEAAGFKEPKLEQNWWTHVWPTQVMGSEQASERLPS